MDKFQRALLKASQLESELAIAVAAREAPLIEAESERLRRLASEAIGAMHALAQAPGIEPQLEVRLLQRCVDMRRLVDWPQPKDDTMVAIADRAHYLYMSMATVDPDGQIGLRPFTGLNILAYLRAAEMDELGMYFRCGSKQPSRDFEAMLQVMYPRRKPLEDIRRPVFDFRDLTHYERRQLLNGHSPWPIVETSGTFVRAAQWNEWCLAVAEALPQPSMPAYEDPAMVKLIVDYAELGPQPGTPLSRQPAAPRRT